MDDLKELLKAALRDRGVWGAFLNFAGGIIFFGLPDFPKEIWALGVAFVNSILGAIGIVQKWRQVRARTRAAMQPQPVQPK